MKSLTIKSKVKSFILRSLSIPSRLAKQEPVTLLEIVWFAAILVIIITVIIYDVNPHQKAI